MNPQIAPHEARSSPASAIARHLEHARMGLDRLTAEQAFAEMAAGALLVDTRTFEQRRVQGDVPGALCIDRTVLEWRLDPTSQWCISEVEGPETPHHPDVPSGLQLEPRSGITAGDRARPGDRHHRRLRSLARGRASRFCVRGPRRPRMSRPDAGRQPALTRRAGAFPARRNRGRAGQREPRSRRSRSRRRCLRAR